MMRILSLLLLLLTFGWAFAQDDEEPDFDFDEESVEVIDTGDQSKASSYWTSWVEYRWGRRTVEQTANIRDETVNELRFQIEGVRDILDMETHLRVDFHEDRVLDHTRMDLRELYVKPPTPSWLSLAIGRQVVMTGLGDVIFVNDLFPKDWNSFYIGRDAEAEYMKLGTDGIKADIYTKKGTFNLIYGARFRPYITPHGERLVYYNPFVGEPVGDDHILPVEKRDKWFTDDFWKIRYTTTVLKQELYLYINNSFWPDPFGVKANGKFYYPKLRTYGMAMRGNLFSGIWAMEAGLYDSLEDPDGSKPNVANGEFRWYAAYDKELMKDFQLGMQWLNFYRQDQAAYLANLQPGEIERPEHYEMWTIRLTRMLMQQKLTLSFYTYYSPSDKDYYARINIFYKMNDKWHFHIGSHHLGGDQPHTNLAQMRDNSNAFLSVRYMIR